MSELAMTLLTPRAGRRPTNRKGAAMKRIGLWLAIASSTGCMAQVEVYDSGEPGESRADRLELRASRTDYNFDRSRDLVVAAPMSDVIYVYDGGWGGVSTTPNNVLRPRPGASGLGTSMAAPGDLDGDTYPDLVALATMRVAPNSPPTHYLGVKHISLFRGGPGGLASSPAKDYEIFPLVDAEVVANAGDLNGDRRPDVLIGGPGRVAAAYGSPSGIDAPVLLIARPGRFGTSLASVGDLNGDGRDDFAVGAPEQDANRGRVYVCLSSGAGWTLETLEPPGLGAQRFGSSMADIGDFNGDGLSDLAVGAPGIGYTYVYYRDAQGFESFPGATLLLPTGGAAADIVAPAGDLNEDGLADVLVRAEKSVVVFFGYAGEKGVALYPYATIRPDWYGDADFASAFSGTQERDDSGFLEVLVGAPNHTGHPTAGLYAVSPAGGWTTTPNESLASTENEGDAGSAIVAQAP
jgi:hypothetical protein